MMPTIRNLGSWTCSTCTLINNVENGSCDICGFPRTLAKESSWPCQQCTLINDVSFQHCSACGFDNALLVARLPVSDSHQPSQGSSLSNPISIINESTSSQRVDLDHCPSQNHEEQSIKSNSTVPQSIQSRSLWPQSFEQP
eukprot:724249_1